MVTEAASDPWLPPGQRLASCMASGSGLTFALCSEQSGEVQEDRGEEKGGLLAGPTTPHTPHTPHTLSSI